VPAIADLDLVWARASQHVAVSVAWEILVIVAARGSARRARDLRVRVHRTLAAAPDLAMGRVLGIHHLAVVDMAAGIGDKIQEDPTPSPSMEGN
jgi:hypothetical protein